MCKGQALVEMGKLSQTAMQIHVLGEANTEKDRRLKGMRRQKERERKR